MEILIISDLYTEFYVDLASIYTTISQELVTLGHSVTVYAPCGREYVDACGVKYVPSPQLAVGKTDLAQGFYLEKDVEKVIANKDVVLLLFPLNMSTNAIQIINAHNVPVVVGNTLVKEIANKYIKKGKILTNFYKFLAKNYFSNAIFGFTQSPIISEDFASIKIPTKFELIPFGAKKEFFVSKKTKKNEKFNILLTGEWNKSNRHIKIISAVNKCKNKSKIKLTLLGYGKMQKKLQEIAKNNGIDIEFVLDYSKEVEIFHSADMFINTQKLDVFGVDCAKAIASGLPCLFHNNKRDISNAYASEESLCDFNKAKSIAEKIDYFYENEMQRLGIGQWYKDHSECFDLNKNIEKLENLLLEAIAYKKENQ